jgi:gamma-glutamyltranspeptidase/glutathione hydrolase/leukotriene-C4 hydrolase
MNGRSTKEFAALVVISLILGLAIGQTKSRNVSLVHDSEFVEVTGNRGAVATDDKRCSKAGLEVLEKGGNAVDAAVASLLCLGVVHFHCSGIGGGMIMLVGKKNSSAPGGYSVQVIDAREMAPMSANKTDYTPVDIRGKNSKMSTGTYAIAVPGELKGMEEAMNLFSSNTLTKRELVFKKAIEYAENGFYPSKHMCNAVADKEDGPARFEHTSQKFLYEQNLKKFVDSIRDTPGKLITRANLAETLKTIRDKGFQEFYSGSIADKLLKDIRLATCAEHGEPPENCSSMRITHDDFRAYSVKRREPLQFPITGLASTMYTVPAPGSGSAMAVFLKLMQDKGVSNDELLNYHYILEASKFSNSHLMNLGDPDKDPAAHVTVDDVERDFNVYEPRMASEATSSTALDYYGYMAGPSESNFGTTHVVVATSNGDVVSATSSINDYFGSGVLSSSTGVMLNDQMDDFYVPVGDENRFPYNHVEGGKRPLSAMTPAIMTDSNGNLKLAIGASGGRKIPPAIGQSAYFILNRNEGLKSAIENTRMYGTLKAEGGREIVEQVELEGEHKFGLSKDQQEHLRNDYKHYPFQHYSISVVQAIQLNGDTFTAFSDPRKRGVAAASGNGMSFAPHLNIICISMSLVLFILSVA